MSGAILTWLGTFSTVILHLLAIVVLARLLTPADFGLVAMVVPLIALATLFQEAGLDLAVIQRKEISDEELSTVFWINTAVGVALGLLLLAGAPLLADFYNEPRVTLLAMASGLLVFVAALSAQHMALLNRRMAYGRLAAIDGVSLLVGTAVAIAVAYSLRSYWAIFLLSLCSVATRLLLSWALSGWWPGRCAPLRQVADILRFGAHFTLGSLASFLGRNLDKVLIGRVWGATALGYYERAYKIVLMPILFVHNPLLRLVLPMLSIARDEPDRYRRIFLLAYQSSLLLTVPGVVLLAAAATQVVTLVMGPQWTGGAPIFALLAIGCLAQLATGPLTMLFVSQGRAREEMVSSLVSSLFLSAAFVIGLPWGAAGVAAAFAIAELVRTPFMLWYACRSGPVRLGDMGRVLCPFIAVVALGALLVVLLAASIDGIARPFLFLAVAGLAVYAVALPCLALNRTGRDYLSAMTGMVRPFVARAEPAR